MEAAARERRQRLLALKENRGNGASLVTPPVTSEKRSRDDDTEEKVTKEQDDTIEQKADAIAEQVSHQVENLRNAEIDILSLAPKKIDWDLKRDLASKLDKLERRTERKIAELVRMRLAATKEKQKAPDNLAEAVAAMEADDGNDSE